MLPIHRLLDAPRAAGDRHRWVSQCLTAAAVAGLVACVVLAADGAVQLVAARGVRVPAPAAARVAMAPVAAGAPAAGRRYTWEEEPTLFYAQEPPTAYPSDVVQPQTSLWTAALFAVPVLLITVAFGLLRRQRPAVAVLPFSGVRHPAASPSRRMGLALHGKNKNDNFIDQTFTVIADQLLKFLPTTSREKKAFMYYRDGMSAQGTGDYAEALQNYYEALKLETDPFDRSYILYNIGLIHASNGELEKALEYYYQSLERNPNMPSALNNIAVIYHFQGETAEQEGRAEDAIELFDKAADYWREAIRLAPTNYMEAQNWLQSRGELSPDRPY
eukprot:EG_transcript_13660